MGSYNIVEVMIKELEQLSKEVSEVTEKHRLVMAEIYQYDRAQVSDMYWLDLNGNDGE